MERRVQKGVARGRKFEITVDGERIPSYEGETIAAALLAAGRLILGYTAKNNQPRGMYCGIGVCHECMMEINGIPNTRACQILATPGCVVNTQQGWGKGEEKN